MQNNDMMTPIEDGGNGMADDDHGGSGPHEGVANQVMNGVFDDGIESGGGFVEQDDFGTGDQGAGKGCPFVHATAQLIGKLVFHSCQIDFIEGTHDPLVNFRFRSLGGFPKREGDVVEYVEGVKQGASLEEQADMPPNPLQFSDGEGVQVFPFDHDGSTVGPHQTDQVFQGDAFATTTDADDGGDAVFGDFQIDTVEDHASIELFFDPFHGQDGGNAGQAAIIAAFLGEEFHQGLAQEGGGQMTQGNQSTANQVVDFIGING